MQGLKHADMRLVIIDPVTPRPYSHVSLHTQPLGGTEATVIRIAEGLNAIVLQHNRTENEGRYRVAATDVDPTHIVILREPAIALEMAERYPDSQKFLWMHDLCGPGTDRGKKLFAHGTRLAAAGVTLICVSDFHAADARKIFHPFPQSMRPRVARIYNPVDVSDAPNETNPTDRNKLVFFSSPHKGLDYALTVFSYLHSKNKNLRLYIANPGYLANTSSQLQGVVNLGAVSHRVIMEHVSTALCTFYPNYVYPETFGLALAESNALGVPVLTHDIGAASEVLNGEGQFVRIPRIRSLADSIFWRWPSLRPHGEVSMSLLGFSREYRDRIDSWQTGRRPVVAGRTEFSIDAVIAAWHSILEAPVGLELSAAR
jgi:glycosyltransferase involved in cell wall biosynthesis